MSKRKIGTKYAVVMALVAVALLSMTGSTLAAPKPGSIARVAGDSNDRINLRTGPSTNYEVDTRLAAGEAVEVYDGPRTDSEGNSWLKVRNQNGSGWMSSDFLASTSSKPATSSSKPAGSSKTSPATTSKQQAATSSSAAKIKIGGAVVVKDAANAGLRIRSKANGNSTVLATVDPGTVLRVRAEPVTDGSGQQWYPVNGRYTVGWVASDYIAPSKAAAPQVNTKTAAVQAAAVQALTTARTGVSRSPRPSTDDTASRPAPAVNGQAGDMVAGAYRYLGYRYVYGGDSPRSGFDCSGYIAYVMNNTGWSIGHSLSQQLASGPHVAMANLQPGDLVFFANTYHRGLSHVGMYIGNGNFIHAESEATGIRISDLYSSYYQAHYYSATRPTR